MTDRVASLTVTLKKDMRVDDVEDLKKAISMIRNVASVENGLIPDISFHMARERAAHELREKLFQVLDPALWGDIEKAKLT